MKSFSIAIYKEGRTTVPPTQEEMAEGAKLLLPIPKMIIPDHKECLEPAGHHLLGQYPQFMAPVTASCLHWANKSICYSDESNVLDA